MDRPVVISMIAPIYGVGKYITKFADSVLGQTYPHIQYIFVNDGTKDDSISILTELIENKYSHLKDRITIVHKENGGLPAARKTGLEYVAGDYVYHVDSDDWLDVDAVEKIASCAQATSADVIYFGFYKEYPDRTKLKIEKAYSYETKDLYIRRMYNHKAFGSVCNKCVKASLYRNNDIHYPRFAYAEDTCLMSQLVGLASSIVCIPEALYHYRKGNPDAITMQKRKKRRAESVRNFMELYEKYRDVPEAENPVRVIFDDIAYRAGWYSLIYGLNLFKEYPYLASLMRRARLRRGCDISIPIQIFLKLLVMMVQ